MRWTTPKIRRAEELRGQGLSHAQIAERLGATTVAIDKMFRRNRSRRPLVWTPEQNARLMEMYEAGTPFKEIEAAFGRSQDSCGRQLRRLRPQGVNPRARVNFRSGYEPPAPVPNNDRKHLSLISAAYEGLGFPILKVAA